MKYWILATQILFVGFLFTLIAKSDWKKKINSIFGIMALSTALIPAFNVLMSGKFLTSNLYIKLLNTQITYCISGLSSLFLVIFVIFGLTYAFADILKNKDSKISDNYYIFYPLSLISFMTVLVSTESLFFLLGIFGFYLAKYFAEKNDETNFDTVKYDIISVLLIIAYMTILSVYANSPMFISHIYILKSSIFLSCIGFILVSIYFVANLASFLQTKKHTRIISKYGIMLGFYLVLNLIFMSALPIKYLIVLILIITGLFAPALLIKSRKKDL